MKKTLIWILALAVGAVLGLSGIAWLNEVMNFIATVYTRLFQLLAVPTIVLAVITTFATFGAKGSGRIFAHTLTYTLLTTFAAAAVGAVLYVAIAPDSLPVEALSQVAESAEGHSSLSTLHDSPSYLDHIISIIPLATSSSLFTMAMCCPCYYWPLPLASDSPNCLTARTGQSSSEDCRAYRNCSSCSFDGSSPHCHSLS